MLLMTIWIFCLSVLHWVVAGLVLAAQAWFFTLAAALTVLLGVRMAISIRRSQQPQVPAPDAVTHRSEPMTAKAPAAKPKAKALS